MRRLRSWPFWKLAQVVDRLSACGSTPWLPWQAGPGVRVTKHLGSLWFILSLTQHTRFRGTCRPS